MFKTYRVLLDPQEGDTATGGESPTSATTTETVESQAGSSPASTEQAEATGEEAEASEEASPMQKIARDILKKSEAQTDTAEEKEEESAVPDKDTTEKKAAEEVDASKADDKGPVPYERFEEVNTLKHQYEAQVKEWEPLVKAQKETNDFLQNAGVTIDEYQDAVQVLALMKTNPREALAKLKPLYEALGQFDDSRLPSDVQVKIDKLAERVSDGEMTQATADELRAMYESQGRQQVQEKVGKVTNAVSERQRQQQVVQTYVKAASDWSSATQKTDPDYKPKAGPNAADGVYELTEAYFTKFLSSERIGSPTDVPKLLEKAYVAARKILPVQKLPPTKPTPSSTTSTTTKLGKPKSLSEAASRIAAKHGISYVPRVS